MSDPTEPLDASVMDLPEFETTTIEEKLALLTNKAYDVIKALVQVILPGVSALYFSLDGIWDLPGETKVIGSIAAVTTFLGVLLRLSKRSYDVSDEKFDGDLVVERTEDGRTVYTLEANGSIPEMAEKNEVLFKVKSEL